MLQTTLTTLTTPTTRVLIDIPDMVKLSLCVILSCIRLVTEMKMAPEIWYRVKICEILDRNPWSISGSASLWNGS